VLEGVHEQLDKVTHTVDFPTEARIEFIERLNDIAPDGLSGNSKVIFGGPSGSDAIEGSIKLAKHNTGRHGLLAFEDPITEPRPARSVSPPEKRTKGYGPLLADAVHVRSGPYRARTNRRCRAVLPAETCCQNGTCARALDAVQRKFEPVWRTRITRRNLGRAVKVRAVSSSRRKDSSKGLRIYRGRQRALLIFDGSDQIRSPAKWFAAEHWDVTPDAMTMAKGIGGSGLPIGAMMYHEQLRHVGAGRSRRHVPQERPAFVARTRANRVY